MSGASDQDFDIAMKRARQTFGPMGYVSAKANREDLLADKWTYTIGLQPLDENGFLDLSRPFMEIMSSRVSWEDAFQKFDKAREDFWEDFWDRNDLWAGVFV